MKQDRRSFIFGMTALAGAMELGAAGRTADAALPKRGPAKLKFGVCSDIHSGPWDHGYGFGRACAWWKKEKVDAIVIAGDIADCGDVASCGYVRDIIQKEFGDNWPEMVVCWGNHDNNGNKETGLTTENRAKVLKEFFKVSEAGDANIYLKKVRGYSFVVRHWQGSWQNKEDVGTFLKGHAADVKGPKPFFYVQHPHLKGTCHGPWVWGQDDGLATEAMRQHPNAVCFSGHSHTPLSDERAAWKGEFISIGTASMTNMGYLPGRENSKWGVNDPKQPALSGKLGCHAQLVSVYDDALVIERRSANFADERAKIGDEWVVPLGKDVPWTFEERAAKSVAPAFAAGAALKVEHRQVKPKDEKKTGGDEMDLSLLDQSKKDEQREWVVTFPTALAQGGRPRALEYEVTAVCDSWDFEKRQTKRVWSERFMQAFYNDPTGYCVFADRELPPILGAGRVRFEVRPVSPFGKTGEPLVSESFDRAVKKGKK